MRAIDRSTSITATIRMVKRNKKNPPKRVDFSFIKARRAVKARLALL
jgi:hypothetical protein